MHGMEKFFVCKYLFMITSQINRHLAFSLYTVRYVLFSRIISAYSGIIEYSFFMYNRVQTSRNPLLEITLHRCYVNKTAHHASAVCPSHNSLMKEDIMLYKQQAPIHSIAMKIASMKAPVPTKKQHTMRCAVCNILDVQFYAIHENFLALLVYSDSVFVLHPQNLMRSSR